MTQLLVPDGWVDPCRLAVFETNRAMLPTRVIEARLAINARVVEPCGCSEDEQEMRVLAGTLKILQLLCQQVGQRSSLRRHEEVI